MTSAVRFTLNGRPVAIEPAPGESLLDALRERCGVTSIKDGCQPQGQCGCCLALSTAARSSPAPSRRSGPRAARS